MKRQLYPQVVNRKLNFIIWWLGLAYSPIFSEKKYQSAQPSLFLLLIMIFRCIILVITYPGINNNAAHKECINPVLHRSGLQRMYKWIIKRSQSRNVVAVSRIKHPHCTSIHLHTVSSLLHYIWLCPTLTSYSLSIQFSQDQPWVVSNCFKRDPRQDLWAKNRENTNLEFTLLFPALLWVHI